MTTTASKSTHRSQRGHRVCKPPLTCLELRRLGFADTQRGEARCSLASPWCEAGPAFTKPGTAVRGVVLRDEREVRGVPRGVRAGLRRMSRRARAGLLLDTGRVGTSLTRSVAA
jgi:hypothetical protein